MKQPTILRRQTIIQKKVPARQAVLEYLTDANRRNPGPWHKHSLLAGEAAGLIAARCPRLDPDVAYALGVLHDIGRREGVSHMHHTIAGYNFMMDEGFDSVARICLTHSFPIKELEAYDGSHDCSDEEIRFLSKYLERTDYDDYDRLIQLCDALSSADGFCLIEKRLLDVVSRYGTNSHSRAKIDAYLSLRDYFSDLIGVSIYSVLPGVVENSFGYRGGQQQ